MANLFGGDVRDRRPAIRVEAVDPKKWRAAERESVNVTLVRFCYHSQMGTFGTMTVGSLSWPTVEQAWNDNRIGTSCIPLGAYPLKPAMHYSGDGVGGKPDYPCYEVCDVPGRSLIHIHRANKADELRGCIAPGVKLGAINNVWAVLASADAFAQFMAIMQGEEGTLTIRNTATLGVPV